MSVPDISVSGAYAAQRAGLAAALIAGRDWSAHPLGDRGDWPADLRAHLRAMLKSPLATYIVWGEARIFFFNDAYMPILEDRLPGAMGARIEDLWADAWPAVEPAFLTAEAGEGVRIEDLPVTVRRAGTLQDTWWTFSYAPLDDDDGRARGVLCITTETTARVRAARIAAANDERNRQILDSATDFAIVATDLDGRVTRWNEGARRVLGWTEEEMLGQPLDRCFVPEDVGLGVPAAERRAALDHGSAAEEGWRLRRGTHRFWAAGQLTPIRDADGRAIGFVKILRDRTDQRLAAERLAYSEAQLADALGDLRVANDALATGMAATLAERDRMWEMSPDLLHVVSTDGVLLRVNPAWSAILGYAPTELVGTRAVALLHPDDIAPFHAGMKAVIDAAGSLTAAATHAARENRVRHRDGTYRWFSWLAVAVPGGDAIYATGRHITAEKEREEKLRDTRDFARLALNAIGGVGVWTSDLTAGRYYCDAAIAELYALDLVEGALGLDRAGFFANVHPDDRAAIDHAEEEPGDSALEYRIVHPEGALRWVLARVHTSVDSDGVPIRRTAIGVDMTRQRLIEEQLRQSQKVEAVGQLTGGVAHDFNNLLTVIRGSVDLLRRPGLSEARRTRYVDAISDTTDRATKLTSQLLAFARRQALKPETFDARDSVSAVAEMIETLVGPRVAVSLALAASPCLIDVDRSQFDTALVNMAVNARDAMQGEGGLVIRVDQAATMPAIRAHPVLPGSFVAIALSDTGSGIPADELDRIFEPFFTTKGVGHGTGLGLSQVFGFARQSGGDVIAESRPGEGATFTLYLPCVDGAAPAAPAIATASTMPVGDGICILVVEDSPDVGAFATHALAELGYGTHYAASAAAALEILAGGYAIDAVFADVVMPGMSGIDLALEIRRLYPALPVILTSGYSAVLAQTGSHGFDLVQKPYSIDTLSRALRRVVDARAPEA